MRKPESAYMKKPPGHNTRAVHGFTSDEHDHSLSVGTLVKVVNSKFGLVCS